LETESQRVWDYGSDGYVHRLVQSKADGKVVEVPSPENAEASASECAPVIPPVSLSLYLARLTAFEINLSARLYGLVSA
jgi:hypothetical protein